VKRRMKKLISIKSMPVLVMVLLLSTVCEGVPPNDDCENAEPVGNVMDLAFDTTDATFDGPGLCMISPNLWYCYTASCTGDVTVSLLGSSYDTMLAVYDGCECYPASDDWIGCNDDTGGSLQSEITFFATAGSSYLIEVGGSGSDTGLGVLSISCEGVQEVYPTGDPAWSHIHPVHGTPCTEDVYNVQNAVIAGGEILLKATNAAGDPQYFNFDAYNIVEVMNQVVIKGEPGSITLPDGRTSDRTTIYGGGGDLDGIIDPEWQGRAGAFTINLPWGSFEISNLWLDSSLYASIFVLACDGTLNACRICDNVITYVRPVEWWWPWGKAIAVGEWTVYPVGDIIIERNQIEYNPNPPYIDIAEAISLVRIQTASNITIRENNIVMKDPGSKGVRPYSSPYTSYQIENNTIDVAWTGIHGSGTGSMHISGNIIRSKFGDGLSAGSEEPATVSGNMIEAGQRGIYVGGMSVCTITENTINAATDGIHAYQTAQLCVSSNTITGPMEGRGIWLEYMNQPTVTENVITGEMLRGIYTESVSNAQIRNNMIDRLVSPSWHAWYNGAIAIDYGENNSVENNVIRGEGRSAIHFWRTHNNSVLDNDCSGYTCRWPGQTWNVCQFWDSDYSSGNTLSGNIWGPVPPESRLATVVLSMRFGTAPSDNNILDNDYTLCGVPGWTDANPDGPGCVLLTEGTQKNFVSESGNFPPGTGGAKKQVLDVQALPPPDGLGSTTNRVVGHPAEYLEEDVPPGIGQRLKEIMAEIEVLSTEEEEEEALLEESP